MQQRRAVLAAWCVLVGLMCCSLGCTTTQAVSRHTASGFEAGSTKALTGPLHFVPGERIKGSVSMFGVKAGELAIEVEPSCELRKKELYTVRSIAKSAGIAEMLEHAFSDVVTLVDNERPRETRSFIESDDAKVSIRVGFSEGLYKSVYTREGKKTSRGTQKLPNGEWAHDLHTGLGVLRAWRGEPGERAHLHEVVGRRLFRADVVFAGREVLVTDNGPYSAVRIDGVITKLSKTLKPVESSKPRHFKIWFSDDKERIPLRAVAETSIGDLDVMLVSYEPGNAKDEGDEAAPSAGVPAAANMLGNVVAPAEAGAKANVPAPTPSGIEPCKARLQRVHLVKGHPPDRVAKPKIKRKHRTRLPGLKKPEPKAQPEAVAPEGDDLDGFDADAETKADAKDKATEAKPKRPPRSRFMRALQRAMKKQAQKEAAEAGEAETPKGESPPKGPVPQGEAQKKRGEREAPKKDGEGEAPKKDVAPKKDAPEEDAAPKHDVAPK